MTVGAFRLTCPCSTTPALAPARPAAILAYLCRRGKSLAEGLALLKKGVGEKEDFVEPHEVFLEQLRDYFDLPEADDGDC